VQGEGPPVEQVKVVTVGDVAGERRHGLTIATWNVLCDTYVDAPEVQSPARAPRLAASLVRAAPDIICLQETTPAVLAALDSAWPEQFWRTDWSGELAILSRYPITKAICVSLGENTSKKALIVEVFAQSRDLAVANVHLTSDRRGDRLVDNSEKRASQARVLRIAMAKSMPHADGFVCGDFNEPNIDGLESAVLCMEGLVDTWSSVHGGEDPGYTFDPRRNEIAASDAIDKMPKRIDRIFAAPRWRPLSASLLGESQQASDHFGVVAGLDLESTQVVKPVHTSALVLLPPEVTWKRLDKIRKRFDPSFGRWMPHINVLYGFVPEAHFDEATLMIERVVRCHGPFQVCLDKFVIFEHGKSASLVLVSTCSPADAIIALQQDLQAAFPQCTEQSSRAMVYQPHLTVGKFDSAEEARRVKAELEQDWQALTFATEEVVLLARTGDRPFQAAARVPLGATQSAKDAALLEALEARSGARAFLLGSGLLLGADRPRGSDCDVLLVGPRRREVVFEELGTAMSATWVRRAEGQFPVLVMEVDGVHLDVQYAQSRCHLHPLYWPGQECCEGGQASGALRDALTLRSTILRAQGFGGWLRYQRALLRIKKWAKSRGIYSNALGYFGGWSWSVLLAAAALAGKHDDSDSDGRSLAAFMFKRYAAWPWPKPVELCSSSAQEPDAAALNAGGEGLMPVLCPTGPRADSARNVTLSTRAAIQAEMQLAADGAARGPVLGGLQVVVRCQVLLSEGPEHSVCSGWVEARLIQLVRRLDALQPRPLKIREGLWAIGLGDPRAREIDEAIGDFQELLAQHLPCQSWSGNVEVQVEDPEDFKFAMSPAQVGS